MIKTISPLYPIAQYLPRPILDQIYKIYIRPHFDYCDTIYDGHITVHDMTRLETLQNRVARDDRSTLQNICRQTPTRARLGKIDNTTTNAQACTLPQTEPSRFQLAQIYSRLDTSHTTTRHKQNTQKCTRTYSAVTTDHILLHTNGPFFKQANSTIKLQTPSKAYHQANLKNI